MDNRLGITRSLFGIVATARSLDDNRVIDCIVFGTFFSRDILMTDQEDKQRKLQIAEYESLVSEVEGLLMEFGDADIHDEEISGLIRYFSGFESRTWPFEVCSIIKQQERLGEMEGIRDSLIDLRDRLITAKK